MAMKTVNGTWIIDLVVDCPYCGEYLDEDCLPPKVGLGEAYRGKIKCPACGKKFIANIN